MPTYNSFEDLPVWKKAKELALFAYKVSFNSKLREDYGLRNQIQRAAVSVSANIAEGFERGSKREFIQFLYIARGSCGELRSHLTIAKEVGSLNDNSFKTLYDSCVNVSKQINGFLEYLKTSNFKGQKFKEQSEI
ncbi:MAG: four helix bundle protein [Planctomycetota bacterium]|jgi:four helix bundle protein